MVYTWGGGLLGAAPVTHLGGTEVEVATLVPAAHLGGIETHCFLIEAEPQQVEALEHIEEQ